jgi:Uma2 family endonuclease
MTAEELLKTQIPDKRTELIEGVLLVREPGGYTHGRVTMNLAARLGAHVERNPAGQLLAGETGFTLSRGPDTVRAADIAYVRQDRLPHPETTGFLEFAPDLVVEVLNPDDRPRQIQEKVGQWLNAGALLVWVVDPRRQTTHVYRADGTEEFVGPEGSLNGEEVLPGFVCPLKNIM